MTYIGVGRRAVAVIIDALLSLVVAVPLAAAGGGFRSTNVNTPGGTSHTYSFSLTGIPLLVTVIVWLAYMIYTEGTWGASLGKRMTGIRVVKVDGTPIDMQASLVRNLLRLVDGLFVYLVAAILVWTSPTRQRLGDRAAGTVVVPAHEATKSYGFGVRDGATGATAPRVPPPPPTER